MKSVNNVAMVCTITKATSLNIQVFYLKLQMFRSKENQHQQQELMGPRMTRYNFKSREVLVLEKAATGEGRFSQEERIGAIESRPCLGQPPS